MIENLGITDSPEKVGSRFVPTLMLALFVADKALRTSPQVGYYAGLVESAFAFSTFLSVVA